MIAAIESTELHIVLHVGRQRLSVIATTYCGKQLDAAHGTVQVPDRIFKDKVPWRQVSPGPAQGKVLHACQTCVKQSS